MRAAGFSSFGPPEVLQLIETDVPQAGTGEVRIRVKAAGVQPYDCAVRGGWTPPGATVRFPQIPGNEFAGIVDQIGEGVVGFSLGDEILGFGQLNCYAEYLTIPASQVTLKPQGMSWEAAGGFTAGAQTAHIALQELRIGKGDTVLIHAAAGSVGTIAVQLAKLWGASKVIGSASERNHDYLRSLGAIPVSYGDGLLDRIRALAPDGVDAVLDGAGGEALKVSLELVSNRERILTLVEHAKAPELGIRVTPHLRSAARLAELADMYVQGKLRTHIRRAYPLAQAADAHREVETGHGQGKVVLTID
ncbi:NADP-dependent oxidoreductase [Paenibacillus sp. sptzw28]|uniref:NADP-dependent oxidoreductase n=1 Tax=Paenibacillus sp. sptzw28 TaxID=715179 RepID=UPI001C6DFBB8|nr:NADP-dependent oxidoreductase [Paenibacillus sp. sptzw28]QYR23858.1 NADP-dependent oxidoreductase [Paenibacillus sp. sptzw28]